MNKLLSTLYYDPSSSSGFRSLKDLYIEAKKLDKTVTVKKVRDFLHSQPNYTIFARARYTYPRARTVSYGYLELVQADLAEFQQLKYQNSHFRYVLIIVCVLSKRVFLKAAKNKLSSTIASLTEDVIRNKMESVPNRFQTDRGKFLPHRVRYNIEAFFLYRHRVYWGAVPDYVETLWHYLAFFEYSHQIVSCRGNPISVWISS